MKDPNKIAKKSNFTEKEMINLSPRPEYLNQIKEINENAIKNVGAGVAEFQDMVPDYSNINNTEIGNLQPPEFRPKSIMKHTYGSNGNNRPFTASFMANRASKEIVKKARDAHYIHKRPITPGSITNFDKKTLSKSFVNPTACFLQKYDFEPGRKKP